MSDSADTRAARPAMMVVVAAVRQRSCPDSRLHRPGHRNGSSSPVVAVEVAAAKLVWGQMGAMGELAAKLAGVASRDFPWVSIVAGSRVSRSAAAVGTVGSAVGAQRACTVVSDRL